MIVKEYYLDDSRHPEFDVVDSEVHSRISGKGFVPPAIIKECSLGGGVLHPRWHSGQSNPLSKFHSQDSTSSPERAVNAGTAQRDGEATEPRNASKLRPKIRPKRLSVLTGTNVNLEYAKSVNDLLKAAYDAIEVHRAVARRHRQPRHRDMSSSNILMYPATSDCDERFRCVPFQPRKEQVLTEEPLPNNKRWNSGVLVVDLDYLARPDITEDTLETLEKMQYRMSTSTSHIARAMIVSAEMPASLHCLRYKRMPALSAKARSLYVKAHGEERYIQYCDDLDGNTRHGGTITLAAIDSDVDDLIKLANNTVFCHRLRYDAESVFWVLYSILLRVLPTRAVETASTASMLKNNWQYFMSHTIPVVDNAVEYRDNRILLFTGGKQAFKSAFLPKMQDVADLLYEMAKHVLPLYALMAKPPPHEDHLHEALQRLILEYLVAHEDDPIPLTPGVLRTTAEDDARKGGTYGSESNTGTQPNIKKCTLDESQGTHWQFSRKSGGLTLTRHRDDDPLTL
ncbi:hypothetical protein C8Q70DRAFT_1055649 [Cubamyces menziesii]|nr:hypothetical protein C8Q70DRAFT_1055649 [Cubamyces menziesii]